MTPDDLFGCFFLLALVALTCAKVLTSPDLRRTP